MTAFESLYEVAREKVIDQVQDLDVTFGRCDFSFVDAVVEDLLNTDSDLQWIGSLVADMPDVMSERLVGQFRILDALVVTMQSRLGRMLVSDVRDEWERLKSERAEAGPRF